MKKYFCSSDVHSFYTDWVKALEKAGFDKDNPEYIKLFQLALVLVGLPIC